MMDDTQEAQQQEEDDDDDELEDDVFTDKNTTTDETLIRSNPVLHAYIHQIFPQLIRLSTATQISYHQMTLAPLVTQALVVTHQRALECLNNFLLAMNDIPTKYWFTNYSSDAVQLWRWLFSIANDVANSKPDEWARDAILEVVIGCLWALGRGLEQDIVSCFRAEGLGPLFTFYKINSR
jgi:hypothetical protein